MLYKAAIGLQDDWSCSDQLHFTSDRFLEFRLFCVSSKWKDDPAFVCECEHSDVGPVETDI